MDQIKYSIIGAGVIGLAIANELAAKGDGDIVVFEKNEKFGQETSSRNSEVIHAGLYYPKDSLKSRLCLKGNKMLYEYCKKENIPHNNCGKLVVSTDEREKQEIKEIYNNALSAGVNDIEYLEEKDIKKIEPQIFALNALYSKTTGIIDVHKLMEKLCNKSSDSGGMIVLNSEVKSIKKTNEGYILVYSDGEEILSEFVVNSAGLFSDKTAETAGFDVNKLGYKLKFCKGDYFKVSCSPNKISHLIYPPPHEKGYGLGIHATLNLSGYIRLGPDANYVNEINYDMDDCKIGEFYNSAKKMLPWLSSDMISPDTSGIRPKLQGPDDGFKDFVIQEESRNGFPKFINLIGIESPGLTSCLAIGEYVRKLSERCD